MRRFLYPTLILVLGATISVRTATAQRTYSSTAQALSLNGVVCPEVVHWSGGEASATVVVEPPVAGATAKKHLGLVVFEPIMVLATLPLSQPLQDCVAELCAGGTSSKTLLLTNLDFSLHVVGSPLQATNAVLTEVQFPALNSSGREPLHVTLVFRPERMQAVAPPAPGTTTSSAVRPTTVQTSHFRLAIGGLDAGRVSRIDSITIKRATATSAVGDARVYSAPTGETEFPNLGITLADVTRADWSAWRDDFVVSGNNGDAQEKSGSIEILSADLQRVLFSLQLTHVGIMRLAVQPAADGQLATTRADLYCENMSLGAVSAAVTSSGTTTPTPSTTAATDSTASTGSTATTTTGSGTPVTGATPTSGSTATTAPATTIPVIDGITQRTVVPSADTIASPVGLNSTAVSGTSTVRAASTPLPVATTVTNSADQGARDPANFPRPPDTVRLTYGAVRQKGSLQESAKYTAPTNSDAIMAFYEKTLGGDGWEEVSRYENNYATGAAHQILSTWKKDIRSAGFTIVDVAKGRVEVELYLTSVLK